MLRVGFDHADEMGHHVGGFSWALRDEDVDAGSRCSFAGSRSLDDYFVGGLVGHADGGHFADLQASAEQFDAGGAEGIAFEQRDLQLALAEAEHDVRLLRFFHQQAGGGSLAHDDVYGQVAVDAVGYFQD